ncbi:TPA: DUF2513 domain-containing protein [Aeromonas hydrophila]|uniref:DUF2513 domain-containing protein n=1 Tax=Aeromonas hydrophila TaxID=644 RepID=UPI000C31CB1C|nr:DUF2513 domain-containing protein [Aeromonas hydrophila]WRK90009.1 DUF2513 domain-containing protein [Aeromonas hydrophila]HAT2712731.1 DUF2513 domain-containing protein [Aeromonas hydrophila]
MKQNPDTIKDILTRLENLPTSAHSLSLCDFEPEDKEAAYSISYHVDLLIKDGLIEGSMSRELTMEPAHFYARQLTSEGHNRLKEIRDNTLGKRCIKRITKAIGNGVGVFLSAVIGAAALAAYKWFFS